jgi:hypothetical protein
MTQQIFLKMASEDASCPEYTLIEMQGSISSTKTSVQGAELGQLKIEGKKANLHIGAQILEGTLIALNKPLLMIDPKSKALHEKDESLCKFDGECYNYIDASNMQELDRLNSRSTQTGDKESEGEYCSGAKLNMRIKGIVRNKILFKNRPIPVTGDKILK